MRGFGKWGRRCGALGMLAASWLTAGCTCHLSSPPPVPGDLIEATRCVGHSARCHVYLFFIQGCDVTDCAGLETLKETTQALGYSRAWYGPAPYLSKFKKEIAVILREDPRARFVIVGFGNGVSKASDLAEVLAADGGVCDLFVSIGKKCERPTGACRMIAFLPSGTACKQGIQVEGDDVIFVPARILSLPTHPDTVCRLSHELLGLACSNPSVEDLPQMHYPEGEPTPRPFMPSSDAVRSEWDFLRPASADRRPVTPAGSVPVPPGKPDDSTQILAVPGQTIR